MGDAIEVSTTVPQVQFPLLPENMNVIVAYASPYAHDRR